MVKFGRKRAAEGAGPVTVSMDIGVIRLAMSHAAAVHGLLVPVEPVDLARIALKRLGLIGKSNGEADRPDQTFSRVRLAGVSRATAWPPLTTLGAGRRRPASPPSWDASAALSASMERYLFPFCS